MKPIKPRAQTIDLTHRACQPNRRRTSGLSRNLPLLIGLGLVAWVVIIACFNQLTP